MIIRLRQVKYFLLTILGLNWLWRFLHSSSAPFNEPSHFEDDREELEREVECSYEYVMIFEEPNSKVSVYNMTYPSQPRF
jgi:hypothetical protein